MRILILGLAKSGTTALAYKLHEALGKDTILNFEPGKDKGAEDLPLHEQLTSTTSSVVTKNLVFPTTETRWPVIFKNVSKYDKAIWIVRDPRDIIISNFFYHWFQGHKANKEKFATALNRAKRKERNPSEIAFIDLVSGTMTENRAQLEAWQRSWYTILGDAALTIRENLYVLRYEDFVDEKFEGLGKYLELPLSGETQVPDKHQRVVRTRGYDNWRRWFTDEDVTFFQPILSDFLHTMGYDANDWQLTPVESLPAKEGSEYMTKLYNQNKSADSGYSWIRRLASKIKNRG